MKGFKKWINTIKEYYLKLLNNHLSFKKVFENRTIKYVDHNGNFHREDGPAIEWINGAKFWYINGKKHRDDGPAIEFTNGHKEWWLNDKRHKADGPAIEFTNGNKKWFIYGEEFTEEEFLKWQLKNSKTIKLNFQ